MLKAKALHALLAGLSVFLVPGSFVFHTDPGEPPQEPLLATDKAIKIAIKLSAQSKVIVSGQTLQLTAEVWNEGPSDVYVCKDFEQPFWPLCSLTLVLVDSTREYGPQQGMGIDFASGNKASLSTLLTRDWIALRPGHFYGAVVALNPDAYPRLRKPGSYRVLGRFASGGVLAYQGTLSADPQELNSLPAKSWRGEVESSPIIIRVRPKTK